MPYKYRVEELSTQTYATLDAESVGTLLTLFTAHEDWEGVWRYDEFGQRVIAFNPPFQLDAESEGIKNHDIAAVKAWLGAQPKEKRTPVKDGEGNPLRDGEGNAVFRTVIVGRKASTEVVMEAITLAAKARRFHPVRDYLATLPTPSAEEAHATIDAFVANLGIVDEMQWIKRHLVAAVRRVMKPGDKHDYILVLVGEKQGQGKSTLVRLLFDPWFQDNLPDLGSKSAANALRGFWGIELAELEKILRADDATVKAFLSRTEDVFDQKYEKDVSRYPRQCLFVGTTNVPECLRDPTGNRRYWPVRVEVQMDVTAIAAARDVIWAAANAIAATDYRTWMTPEEDERADVIRAEFTELDPWHTTIRRFCEGKALVTIDEVWESLAAVGKGHSWERKGDVLTLDKVKRNRIGGTLRMLKCKRVHGAWRVPDELRLRFPTGQAGVSGAVAGAADATEGDASGDASRASAG